MDCIRCHRDIPDTSAYCLYCGKRQAQAPAAPKKPSRRARSTGSVYKLSGHRSRPWAAVRDGEYIGYFSTKSNAQVALEHVAGRELGASYNYTLAQVYDSWRAEHFPALTAKGQEMYRLAWKRMSPLEGRKMRELRTADYQRIINAMEDTALSASSAQKVKQLAGQLSKWAMREDIITTNYAQFIRIYTDEPTVREIFSDEELARLKASDSDDAVNLILLLIYTGLRIGELFTLRRENVHLEAGYLVGGSKTKAGKNRSVPILPEARSYLQYFYSAADGQQLPQAGFHCRAGASGHYRKDTPQHPAYVCQPGGPGRREAGGPAPHHRPRELQHYSGDLRPCQSPGAEGGTGEDLRTEPKRRGGNINLQQAYKTVFFQQTKKSLKALRL